MSWPGLVSIRTLLADGRGGANDARYRRWTLLPEASREGKEEVRSYSRLSKNEEREEACE